MPRVKSDSYDTKRELIMDQAAQLFSDSGYPSARMMDIAKACDASKSMLYHYFPKKENILYAILIEHMEEVISEINGLVTGNYDAASLIGKFVNLFVQKTAKARARHLTAMMDVKYLPEEQQSDVIALEREIVKLAGNILRLANPKLPDREYNLYALMLIGTINSMDLWRNPEGRYTAEEMADIYTNIFANGFMNI
ncbi:TetR/AcrR family transcriptional regulator [Alteromonas sp. M12]|uniref:TetR/AcrR family transcriptional regulator n=1 Tax=Alteromonas sp. M12 TaxID=3135644 RepID=UPI00319E8810